MTTIKNDVKDFLYEFYVNYVADIFPEKKKIL